MPSKTKKQRRFMRMVKAYKEGKSKTASPEVKKAAMNMTQKQASDFAKAIPKNRKKKALVTETTGSVPERAMPKWALPKKKKKKTAKKELTQRSRRTPLGLLRSA